MTEDKWLLGHEPLKRPLNVRNELSRLRHDPLDPLLEALRRGRSFPMIHDEVSRYREGYRFYYLTLERFLREMSLAVRWSKGPYYVRKYGGRYTPAQRRLATQYNKVARFIELDFLNCIIHARILLDRTISLSRHFLTGGNLPSFASFDQHKKFFERQDVSCGPFEEYARYIREKTDWFDVPLKMVRDKFLVHAGPFHLRVFGFPAGDAELGLIISIPGEVDPQTGHVLHTSIVVSVPRLAREMEAFLEWFCDYGCRVIAADR